VKNQALAIWTVRAEAEPLARAIAARLGDAALYLAEENNRESFTQKFAGHARWVFIGASGIAVRYLSGLPRDKQFDPALVVMDEAARFAIPLLGGHEGGANALAYSLAKISGAMPAITTATEALKPLTLGIGCRKNVSVSQIENAVESALQLVSREIASVRETATLDAKRNEPALLEWCAAKKIPLRIIAREDVAARAWAMQPSAWVHENFQIDGVCEPCALIASPRGKLLLSKTARDGVTVAIVEDAAFPFSET